MFWYGFLTGALSGCLAVFIFEIVGIIAYAIKRKRGKK